MKTICINGVCYEYVSISGQLLSNEEIKVLKVLRDKKIDLVYGCGNYPVGINYNKSDEKIHKSTIEKAMKISHNSYNIFNSNP